MYYLRSSKRRQGNLEYDFYLRKRGKMAKGISSIKAIHFKVNIDRLQFVRKFEVEVKVKVEVNDGHLAS